MTIAAFLHGYPPDWSMGGEVSTHRTLRSVEGSNVFTNTGKHYDLEGVAVHPLSRADVPSVMADAESVEADILYAHSTLSQVTVRAARRLKIPSILAVHAPPRYAIDLRRAWPSATVKIYNTEVARQEWKDPKGWLLHPPVGVPVETVETGDALTITSSLLNKGANQVLSLAKKWPHRRFIVVASPAHATHGTLDFFEKASELDNVEIWPRQHPNEMHILWAETKILLVPSRYETYGLSAIEAAWHGIPSIHVDTPHVREGIGTASRLLKTQTVEELGMAVLEVEQDYTRWSATAHSRAHELHLREMQELDRFAGQVAGLALRQ